MNKKMANVGIQERIVQPNNKLVRALVPNQRFTPAGRKWIERVCNPCDTAVVCHGVPDLMSTNVVTPSERSFFDINLNTHDLVTTDRPPSIEADTPWNLTVFGDGSTGLVFYSIDQAEGKYSAFGCYQSRLNFLVNTKGEYSASRLTFMGVTLEMTGPTVEDQGELTAGQFVSNNRPYVTDGTTDTDLVSFYRYPLVKDTGVSFQDLDLFYSEIPESDNQSVGHKAKLGAYSILKLAKPVLDMVEHQWEDNIVYASGTPTKYDLERRVINPMFAALYDPSIDKIALNNRLKTSKPVIQRDSYGFNSCVIRVTGISPKSSFRLKLYQGYELSCTAESSGRFYTHPSPDDDEAAMKMAHHILTRMPSAFPSDYNAFGWLRKLWGGIKKPISQVLPVIGAAAGNVVAPGIGGAIGGNLGNMLGGWMS